MVETKKVGLITFVGEVETSHIFPRNPEGEVLLRGEMIFFFISFVLPTPNFGILLNLLHLFNTHMQYL